MKKKNDIREYDYFKFHLLPAWRNSRKATLYRKRKDGGHWERYITWKQNSNYWAFIDDDTIGVTEAKQNPLTPEEAFIEML